MKNKRKALVLGCNFNQIPYIIELKKKYFVIGCDKNKLAPGKKVVNTFFECAYDNFKTLKKICLLNKDIQVVFSASSQFSILGVSYLKLNNLKLSYASFFKALNLETKSSVTNFNYALINEILNYDVVAAKHYYLSGIASIKEENYTRIYKSLVSLQRLSDKNKIIYKTYVKLNDKILIFLNNRN